MIKQSLSKSLVLIAIRYSHINAFIAPKAFDGRFMNVKLLSQTENTLESGSLTDEKQKKILGLLTFDLDDTLYPISTVVDEANKAFCEAMERFGYEGIKPSDIIEVGRQIRKEMSPSEAASLSHTDVRSLAIRRVMEEITFKRKLEAMAEDFSTDVENLSKIVVEPARR